MADISRVLITGGESRIGCELDFGIKLTHKELDITDSQSIAFALDKYSPSAVLNLASVDIKNSQTNPYLANKVNVFGVYNLVVETKKRNIPLIIISTGAIFNGDFKKTFTEKDVPNPKNIYGQTKYLAELIITKTKEDYTIIRTGWLFGGKAKNGFAKFVKEAIISARENKSISATSDKIGSPTYIPDLIENIKKLIVSNKKGTFHLINEGSASAVDFVEEIIRTTGSLSAVNKIISSDISDIERSESEVLSSTEIKLRPWQQALAEYIRLINLECK